MSYSSNPNHASLYSYMAYELHDTDDNLIYMWLDYGTPWAMEWPWMSLEFPLAFKRVEVLNGNRRVFKQKFQTWLITGDWQTDQQLAGYNVDW
jgi:hypothetical protein